MLTMLGIPNCDTIRKARTFLENNQVAYTFRDIRKQPLDEAEWRNLVDQDADRVLVNTRGPSFRKTGHKAADLDAAMTLAVLLEQPSAMKRPVMVRENRLLSVGFKAETFLDALGSAS